MDLYLSIMRYVALRKESVDRNAPPLLGDTRVVPSLSVRRAWIEMLVRLITPPSTVSRSP